MFRTDTNDNQSHNLAARMGRWSAAHWKTAVFGWLALVVVAFGLGGLVGTKNVDPNAAGPGESGRMNEILDAGFKQPAGESVLIQSGSVRVGEPAFTAAIEDVVARVSTLAAVQNVRSPLAPGNAGQIAKGKDAALVEFDIRGDRDEAGDKVGPVVDAVADAQRAHPGFFIGEFGEASAVKASDDVFADDLGKAGLFSLPITLVILVVAFGALVAAGIPLLLALTAVFATFGLAALPSQVLPLAREDHRQRDLTVVGGVGRILCTAAGVTGDLVECLRAGAAGYILKNIAADTLVDALLKVHRGESVISPKMTSRLIRDFRAQQPAGVVIESRREEMSPREQEILRARGPKTLRTACLLSKPSRRQVNVKIEYVGFTIEDHFVVGYGLDYAEQYRNLPHIAVVGVADTRRKIDEGFRRDFRRQAEVVHRFLLRVGLLPAKCAHALDELQVDRHFDFHHVDTVTVQQLQGFDVAAAAGNVDRDAVGRIRADGKQHVRERKMPDRTDRAPQCRSRQLRLRSRQLAQRLGDLAFLIFRSRTASLPAALYRSPTKRPGFKRSSGSNWRLTSRMSLRPEGDGPQTSTFSFSQGGAAASIAWPPELAASAMIPSTLWLMLECDRPKLHVNNGFGRIAWMMMSCSRTRSMALSALCAVEFGSTTANS